MSLRCQRFSHPESSRNPSSHRIIRSYFEFEAYGVKSKQIIINNEDPFRAVVVIASNSSVRCCE